MIDILIRFAVGGLSVSGFAVLADMLRPKSFAGLFAAAPSVALATSILTIHSEGISFAAVEARTMIFGSFAFFCYACGVCYVVMRFKFSAYAIATSFVAVWRGVALGLNYLAS